MKGIFISIGIAALLIGGAIIFTIRGENKETGVSQENVRVEEGIQIIEIIAKGRYMPRVSWARAGMPTILRVHTSSTFDCTAAISIPALSYREHLPPTGTVDIKIPSQAAGAELKGICAMGMYGFTIRFE